VAPQKFAATISWGDDTTSQGTVAGLGAGQYGIDATHTYWNFGRYPISVQIADTHLRGAIARTTATIQDARISVRGRTIRTKGLVFEGTIAVAQDEDPSESALNLHVIVDWGDGKRSSASPLDLFGGRFRLVARHRYGRPAVYRAVIRVRTAGGSKAQTTSTIRVDR
jgi:hypothetical protein